MQESRLNEQQERSVSYRNSVRVLYNVHVGPQKKIKRSKFRCF